MQFTSNNTANLLLVAILLSFQKALKYGMRYINDEVNGQNLPISIMCRERKRDTIGEMSLIKVDSLVIVEREAYQSILITVCIP